ncbi:hypothetical protein BJ878DRAFT_524249 [Calycina marina]|uniref:Uncharacterized protein n=1 Tax=Calycina marina TaxID=1763456 RepID=A0A9P8CBC9_9HELO|nr:hypothetical protein BJ878DRAFT_524249 [Calycina marina]
MGGWCINELSQAGTPRLHQQHLTPQEQAAYLPAQTSQSSQGEYAQTPGENYQIHFSQASYPEQQTLRAPSAGLPPSPQVLSHQLHQRSQQAPYNTDQTFSPEPTRNESPPICQAPRFPEVYPQAQAFPPASNASYQGSDPTQAGTSRSSLLQQQAQIFPQTQQYSARPSVRPVEYMPSLFTYQNNQISQQYTQSSQQYTHYSTHTPPPATASSFSQSQQNPHRAENTYQASQSVQSPRTVSRANTPFVGRFANTYNPNSAQNSPQQHQQNVTVSPNLRVSTMNQNSTQLHQSEGNFGGNMKSEGQDLETLFKAAMESVQPSTASEPVHQNAHEPESEPEPEPYPALTQSEREDNNLIMNLTGQVFPASKLPLTMLDEELLEEFVKYLPKDGPYLPFPSDIFSESNNPDDRKYTDQLTWFPAYSWDFTAYHKLDKSVCFTKSCVVLTMKAPVGEVGLAEKYQGTCIKWHYAARAVIKWNFDGQKYIHATLLQIARQETCPDGTVRQVQAQPTWNDVVRALGGAIPNEHVRCIMQQEWESQQQRRNAKPGTHRHSRSGGYVIAPPASLRGSARPPTPYQPASAVSASALKRKYDATTTPAAQGIGAASPMLPEAGDPAKRVNTGRQETSPAIREAAVANSPTTRPQGIRAPDLPAVSPQTASTHQFTRYNTGIGGIQSLVPNPRSAGGSGASTPNGGNDGDSRVVQDFSSNDCQA